jgi:hypothetical protein
MRPARGSTELKNAPGKEERRTAVVSPETGCDAEIGVDAGLHSARRGLRAPDAKADEVYRNFPWWLTPPSEEL